MNVLNVAGVTYDIDKLSEDVQESCVYLNKAQQLAGKIQAEFEVNSYAIKALTKHVEENLNDDAIVAEEDVPTED